MGWKAVPPTHLRDIPVVDSPTGTSRQTLFEDAESGFRTTLMTMPVGWKSPYSGKGLEFHSSQEEVFNLAGILHFGHWHDFSSFGYLNHPPYWVHPSDEATDTGLRLLMKYAGPFDIDYTPFPDDWDGTEFVAGGRAANPQTPGVTGVDLDTLLWEPVHDDRNQPLGIDAKVVYRNGETGWTTWLMRAPAGWVGPGEPRTVEGGDEIFVIDGDLTVCRPEPVDLTAGSYFCDPDRFIYGGSEEKSQNGCLAIRWTRNVPMLQLPPPQTQ